MSEQENEREAELLQRIAQLEKRLGIKSKSEKERERRENNRLQAKDELIYSRRRHP
jgi:hypothetical protein